MENEKPANPTTVTAIPSSPYVPTPEITTKSSQNKKFAIGVVVVLLLLVVIAAAGFIYYWNPLSKPSAKPTSSVITQKIPSPIPDPITDWKTYINSQYNYSIKYPPILGVVSRAETLPDQDKKNVTEDSAIQIAEINDSSKIYFAITVVSQDLNLYKETLNNNSKVTSIEDLIVEEKKAVSYILNGNNKFIAIENGENIYELDLVNVIGDGAIQDQILSTFEFTVPQPILDGPKKQFYSALIKYIDYKYLPDEITQARVDELQEISCSQYYQQELSGSGKYYGDSETNQVPIQRVTKLIKIFETIESQTGKKPPAGFYCETVNNTIIVYEQHGGGGGGLNIANVGIYKDDGSITQIATIPNDGAPYFGCNKIVQFNKSGDLYVACGGGYSNSFYKLNIYSKTKQLLIQCKNDPQKDGTVITNCTQ